MISKLRWLFLLVGLAGTGYAAYRYVDAAWLQQREDAAFEEARGTPASHASPVTDRPFPARLSIPSLGLQTIVEEGASDKVLRYAAGHVASTAKPGQQGNVVVAAHRDTIFRGLRLIRQGDVVTLETRDSSYEYMVDRTSIVNPSDVSVLKPIPGSNTLTLVTCYPFYFVGAAPKRFIVSAHQVRSGTAAE